MEHKISRRRLLTSTAVLGGVVAIAGCNEDGSADDDGEAEETDAESDDGGDDESDDGEDDESDDGEDDESNDGEDAESDDGEDAESDDGEDAESDDEEDEENRVLVAPDGDWRFEPEELTISVDETVTWYFDAPGHNVTSHPDASNQNENPDDAEPFTSYEDENHSAVNEEGTEYEHTFEVAGEYVYVCEPHDGTMIGTIIVEE